jgi:hypothetical protein
MAKAILALINAFDWLADKIASAGAAIIIMADKINAKIQSVVAWVDTIREKLVNFLNGAGIPKTALDFVVNFWGTGSATLPISEKIGVVNAELDTLTSNISSLSPSYTADFHPATSAITTVQTQYDDLNVHISQNPLTLTVDTSQAVAAIQNLEEQHKKVMQGWDSQISSIQGLPEVKLAAGQAKRDAEVSYQNQLMHLQVYGTEEERKTATQLLANANSHNSGYALGTSYVPKTGTYLLHQGESVVPKGNNGGSKNTTIGDININISGDQSPRSGEDYRTIVRNFIIPELQRLGAI